AVEVRGAPGRRRSVAQPLNNLSLLLGDTGRPVEAENAGRRALAIYRELVPDFLDSPDHQNGLAGTLVNLAGVLLTRNDPQAARRLLDEALPHHQAALRANPRSPFYRQFYRNNRWRLTEALLALGEHVEAAETAGGFLRAAVDPPQDAFMAACLLAGCVRLAQTDERLSAERRRELAESYAERAVGLLRQAVAKGYKDLEALKKRPELEPLRSRGDFQALLADLEKKPVTAGGATPDGGSQPGGKGVRAVPDGHPSLQDLVD